MILDTIVTSEHTFTVEFVVFECTLVDSTVGESQSTITMVESSMETAFINNILALFSAMSFGEIVFEFNSQRVAFFS